MHIIMSICVGCVISFTRLCVHDQMLQRQNTAALLLITLLSLLLLCITNATSVNVAVSI
jgi:hypothetical protein